MCSRPAGRNRQGVSQTQILGAGQLQQQLISQTAADAPSSELGSSASPGFAPGNSNSSGSWLSWGWNSVASGASAVGSYLSEAESYFVAQVDGFKSVVVDPVIPFAFDLGVSSPLGVAGWVAGVGPMIREATGLGDMATPSLKPLALTDLNSRDWNLGHNIGRAEGYVFQILSLVTGAAQAAPQTAAGTRSFLGSIGQKIGDLRKSYIPNRETWNFGFGFCFVAGTPVSTESGLRAIETIRPGDRVWAFNHRLGAWQLKTVLQKFERDHHADIVHIAIGGETIQATILHPFWVISGKDLSERPIRSHLEKPPDGSVISGRWVDATDLRRGDQLLLRDGRGRIVETVEHIPTDTVVYNFCVDELKCYAVGKEGILVHNASSAGLEGAGAVPNSALSQLVHLTDDAGKFGIAKTGTINGSHGIFAVPSHVAAESTALKVLRTGLTPDKTINAVPIPNEALGLFSRPVPVGPYSAWKYFGSVQFAPAGSLNIASGAFSSSWSLIGPRVLIYGPDGVFYFGIATAGGLYLYGQTGGAE